MKIALFFALLLIFLFGYAFANKPKLRVNNTAPDIVLEDDKGKLITLSKIKGNRVVIFLPWAGTPNCTMEVCSFKNNINLYKKHKITVISVSYDKNNKLSEFRKNNNFPDEIILLSDKKGKAAKDYGANKGLLGNFFAQRKTFLINENNKIIKILENIDVKTHAEDILEIFNL